MSLWGKSYPLDCYPFLRRTFIYFVPWVFLIYPYTVLDAKPRGSHLPRDPAKWDSAGHSQQARQHVIQTWLIIRRLIMIWQPLYLMYHKYQAILFTLQMGLNSENDSNILQRTAPFLHSHTVSVADILLDPLYMEPL